MTCPRCGLQFQQKGTLTRCPRCGQPFYAPKPIDVSTRVTKVIAEPAPAEPETTFDSAIWPDIDVPLASMLPVQDVPTVPLEPGAKILPSASSLAAIKQRAAQWVQSTRQWLKPEKLQALRRLPSWFVANRRLMAVLGLALVLALVTGGLGYAVNRANSSNHAGHSVVAQRHATATTAATNTATTVPTATAPATFVATKAPQLVTIFADALGSNANGWPTQNGCAFQSDGYHATGGAWCIAPIAAQPATVNISVQVKFTQSTFGGAGIGFRIQNNQISQSYTFLINASGNCSAADLVSQSDNNFFFNMPCPSVHQGANAINTLTINQNGAHMDFYVNGTLVGTANDGTFASGQIALATEGRHTDAIFSDFTLTKWE